jgi:hypothetical protein
VIGSEEVCFSVTPCKSGIVIGSCTGIAHDPLPPTMDGCCRWASSPAPPRLCAARTCLTFDDTARAATGSDTVCRMLHDKHRTGYRSTSSDHISFTFSRERRKLRPTQDLHCDPISSTCRFSSIADVMMVLSTGVGDSPLNKTAGVR